MDFGKAPVVIAPRSRSPSANAQNAKSNEDKQSESKQNDNDKIQKNDKEKDKTEANKLKSIKKPEELQQQKSLSKSSEPPKLEDSGVKMNLNPTNINKMPSSDQITEMPSDSNVDMDLNGGDDDFLSDDLHINNMTEEEKAKMKQDLGLDGMI